MADIILKNRCRYFIETPILEAATTVDMSKALLESHQAYLSIAIVVL